MNIPPSDLIAYLFVAFLCGAIAVAFGAGIGASWMENTNDKLLKNNKKNDL